MAEKSEEPRNVEEQQTGMRGRRLTQMIPPQNVKSNIRRQESPRRSKHDDMEPYSSMPIRDGSPMPRGPLNRQRSVSRRPAVDLHILREEIEEFHHMCSHANVAGTRQEEIISKHVGNIHADMTEMEWSPIQTPRSQPKGDTNPETNGTFPPSTD